MSETRLPIRVAPKGMGLNEFVAMEEGIFEQEGLEVEFDMKTFRGTQSSWKGLEYFDRPQDRVYTEGQEVIQSACQWGTISNAASGMGRVVPDCYGVSPWSIFVHLCQQFKEWREQRKRLWQPSQRMVIIIF